MGLSFRYGYCVRQKQTHVGKLVSLDRMTIDDLFIMLTFTGHRHPYVRPGNTRFTRVLETPLVN